MRRERALERGIGQVVGSGNRDGLVLLVDDARQVAVDREGQHSTLVGAGALATDGDGPLLALGISERERVRLVQVQDGDSRVDGAVVVQLHLDTHGLEVVLGGGVIAVLGIVPGDGNDKVGLVGVGDGEFGRLDLGIFALGEQSRDAGDALAVGRGQHILRVVACGHHHGQHHDG